MLNLPLWDTLGDIIATAEREGEKKESDQYRYRQIVPSCSTGIRHEKVSGIEPFLVSAGFKLLSSYKTVENVTSE